MNNQVRPPLVCYDHMMFFITFNLILFFLQGYIIQPGATSRKISLKIPKGNQNLYIEEEQATQWPREKGQRTNNDIQNIHIKLKIE